MMEFIGRPSSPSPKRLFQEVGFKRKPNLTPSEDQLALIFEII
jgi:hypothetical protein